MPPDAGDADAPEDRPNVLFVLSDQHCYRFLGSVPDGAPVETPALDGVAERGVAFSRAYCPVPVCTPSRMCMLTGREAPDCSAWGNGGLLPEELPTVAETFSEAGYETALVGKMHLGGDRQFAGFDHRPYGDLLGQNGHQYEPVSPEDRVGDGWNLPDSSPTEYPESQHQEVVAAREAVAWLREHDARSDDPWFLCLSLSRPHPPFTAPERHIDRYADDVPEPRTDPEDRVDNPLADLYGEIYDSEADREEMRRARAAYFACVDYLDEVVGDLLATLDRSGFLEDTVVTYTSDHGEQAGERGVFEKRLWYDDATRVPWLLETPAHRDGELSGMRPDRPVSLLDLYPTLCGLCGIDAPDALDGVDLSGAIRAGREPRREPVVVDYHVGVPEGTEYRMAVDGDYKYVAFRDAPELLFDLQADPLETENVAPGATGEARDALERLRTFVEDGIDLSTVPERREADAAATAERDLGLHPGIAGNAYLLDGRVVDAEAAVVKPDVLVERPDLAFADWPYEGRREGFDD
jgi:choline-sulfatase